MRQVSGFSGYYITKTGKIWSTYWDRLLTTHENKDGYLYVHLRKNRKSHYRLVHRLVLETYWGPCPPGYQCRHIDGDRKNNRLSNLKWGTPAENYSDMVKHGTRKTPDPRHAGIRNGRAKLSEADVLEIRRIWPTGEFTKQHLSDYYGVTVTNIRDIVLGVTWKHLLGDAG